MPISKDRYYRSFTEFSLSEKRTENDGGDALILNGVPVVFDTPTVLFEFDGTKYIEIIERHAFDETDTQDFIFNYNHSGRVYARNKNGSLTHQITEKGLECSITLDGTDEGHRQLYRDIKSGRVDKMSFSFRIAPDGVEYKRDKGSYTQIIRKVKKLYDVSAVDFAAYETTSITARSSLLEEYQKELAALEQRRRRLYAKALTYYKN